jgi:hypothetical protein
MALDLPSYGFEISKSMNGDIPNILFCINFLSFAVPFEIVLVLKSDSRKVNLQNKLF